MGTMTFDGRYVKRHRRDRETGLIKVLFYDSPPELVSYEEWQAKKRLVFHDGDVRRRDITRAMAHC